MTKEECYVILNMNCKYEICRRCPKSGLFKGSYEECEKWIKQKKKEETKEEMKNKISMALKDSILQQGFEIICKNLSDLEEENRKLRKEVKIINDANVNLRTNNEDMSKKELKEQLEVMESYKRHPDDYRSVQDVRVHRCK